MCQGFRHFPAFLHHSVLAKLATTSIWVKTTQLLGQALSSEREREREETVAYSLDHSAIGNGHVQTKL